MLFLYISIQIPLYKFEYSKSLNTLKAGYQRNPVGSSVGRNKIKSIQNNFPPPILNLDKISLQKDFSL